MSVSVRAAGLGLVCLFGVGLTGLAPGCGPGLEPPGENDSAGAPRGDAGVPTSSGGRGGSGGTGAGPVAGTGAAAAAGAGAAGVGGAQADDAGVEDDAGR